MNEFLFSPGLSYDASSTDILQFYSNSGRIRLTSKRPSWLEKLYINSIGHVPKNIVLPTEVETNISFTEQTKCELYIGKNKYEHIGSTFTIPSQSIPTSALLYCNGRVSEISFCPWSGVDQQTIPNIQSAFEFDSSFRVSTSTNIVISKRTKESYNNFLGIGSKDAVSINGYQSCPLILLFEKKYLVYTDGDISSSDFCVATHPSMRSSSIVAECIDGEILLPIYLEKNKKLWYGLKNNPYSGGVVISSKSSLSNFSYGSQFGTPVPYRYEFDSSDLRHTSCLMNLSSIHTWSCASINKFSSSESSRNQIVSTGMSTFDGFFWKLSEKTNTSSIFDWNDLANTFDYKKSDLILIEPGIFDGELRLSIDKIVSCKNFIIKSKSDKKHIFVGISIHGANNYLSAELERLIEHASSNIPQGISIAIYFSKIPNGELVYKLEDIRIKSQRDFYVFTFDQTVALEMEKYGFNMLVPNDVSLLLISRFGRKIVSFDPSYINSNSNKIEST